MRREKKKEIYIMGAQKWESDIEEEILSTVDTEFLIHGEWSRIRVALGEIIKRLWPHTHT